MNFVSITYRQLQDKIWAIISMLLIPDTGCEMYFQYEMGMINK